MRKLEQEKIANQRKWKAWKEKIFKDGGGGLSAKLAIGYLNDEEKRSQSNPDLPFFPWAVGFGEAFIGYDYSTDWSREVMLNETLLDAYDKRKLLVNTHGITRNPAVILFANFTHYVMKKEEVVEFTRPTDVP